MKHHLLLGAGPAGVIAAETLRKHAPQDRITLVGDEPGEPYSRMAIPYWLMGQIEASGTHLRHSPTHWRDSRIDRIEARAEGVDVAAHQVHLSNGQTLAYDKLLIATGSHPIHAPIAGIDLPGVHHCWTLTVAKAIMAGTQTGARVVQMGAGFIGCIILEALAARGVALTVVEMGDRMVPRMMGPVAGRMIGRWVESKGIQVRTSARVEKIERKASEGALAVHLASGEVLAADIVITATGVRPAIGFLQDSGVKCLLGVLTDETLCTSDPDIYAAGDCAEAFDKVSGKAIVSAIQPNAAEQARVAALNMAGQHTTLRGVTQINVLDTLGLISASFGAWQGVPGGQQVELTDEAAGRHLSLQFDGDVLVGCNSVGWTQHIGALRGLVEGQIHLGPWKDRLLQDPTQVMPAYLAAAQGQGAWSGAGDARRRAAQ